MSSVSALQTLRLLPREMVMEAKITFCLLSCSQHSIHLQLSVNKPGLTWSRRTVSFPDPDSGSNTFVRPPLSDMELLVCTGSGTELVCVSSTCQVLLSKGVLFYFRWDFQRQCQKLKWDIKHPLIWAIHLKTTARESSFLQLWAQAKEKITPKHLPPKG